MNQGFDVKEVTLDENIPSLINILVIGDIQKPLNEKEMQHLQQYIDRGGNLFIAGEPAGRDYINPLMEQFGVELMDGVLAVSYTHLVPVLQPKL